jgi:hypothetical protein
MESPGGVGAQQDPLVALAEHDRRIADRVDAAGDAGVDLP